MIDMAEIALHINVDWSRFQEAIEAANIHVIKQVALLFPMTATQRAALATNYDYPFTISGATTSDNMPVFIFGATSTHVAIDPDLQPTGKEIAEANKAALRELAQAPAATGAKFSKPVTMRPERRGARRRL